MMSILIYLILGILLIAAVVSSIFWIGLSFMWWKLERDRIKKNKKNCFEDVL